MVAEGKRPVFIVPPTDDGGLGVLFLLRIIIYTAARFRVVPGASSDSRIERVCGFRMIRALFHMAHTWIKGPSVQLVHDSMPNLLEYGWSCHFISYSS